MPNSRRPERRTLGVGGAPRRLATPRRKPTRSPEVRKQGGHAGSAPLRGWSNWKSSCTPPSNMRRNTLKTAEPEPSPVAQWLEPLVVEDLTGSGASTILIDFNNELLQTVPTAKVHARLVERPGTSLTKAKVDQRPLTSLSSRSQRAAGLESNSAWPAARPESRLSSTPFRRPTKVPCNEGNTVVPEARHWQDALTVTDANVEVVEGVGHVAAPSEPLKNSSRCSQGILHGPLRALLPPLHVSDENRPGTPRTSRATRQIPERRWASENTTIAATRTTKDEQVNASTMLCTSRNIGGADGEIPVGGFTAEELWHGHRSHAIRPANTMEAMWHLQPEYHECTPQWTFAAR